MRNYPRAHNNQTAPSDPQSRDCPSSYPSSRRIASVCSPSAGTGSMRGAYAFELSGRQQRRDGPGGRRDVGPPVARLQLLVPPYVVHVVHPCVGDLRGVEPRDHFVDRHPRKLVDDHRAQRVARFRATRVRRKTGHRSRAGACAALSRQNTSHSRSFCSPSMIVLPSPVGNGPYG